MTFSLKPEQMQAILHMEAWQRAIHQTAVEKGWWEKPEDQMLFGKLLLVVTEIAEAAEAFRNDNPMSEHLPKFTAIEEELADAIIRLLDIAAFFDFKVIEAMAEKMEYNKKRPHRHGGKKA